MKRIPIGDFPIGKDERDAILRVLDSNRISEHREVRAFEEEFADWLGVKHCIAVSSGTAALIVGLKAMEYSGEVKPGARILVPALTFVASVSAVKLAGMEPVFADIDPKTFCLKQPRQPRGGGFDATMVVHLFGYSADLLDWGMVPRPLIEDAAEAHGTMYHGYRVGSYGLWGAFSFYIAHTIQAGEMGVVCTSDDEIARIARSIKAHGRACTCKRCTRFEGKCPNLALGDPRFACQYIGYNFKSNEFTAALARVQLTKFDENAEKRVENERLLAKELEPLAGLIQEHYEQEGAILMAYPIVLSAEGIRDRVIANLEKRGVEARPLFGCIPTQLEAYNDYKERYEGKLPVAEYCGANGFYVGCHQFLDGDDIRQMAKTIIEVVRELS